MITEEAARRVLRAHVLRGDAPADGITRWTCTCGQWSTYEGSARPYAEDQHATHVASLMAQVKDEPQ